MKFSLGLALFLSVIPFAASAGSEGKAQVISGFNNRAECISPVRVRKIDGREATVQPMGFELEPGVHTLTGSAVVDASSCKSIAVSGDRYRIEPIEVEFEAGKTYYLGYDNNSPNQAEWKLVIWKVEDSKD